MVRKLKFHEQRLLKNVDFFSWNGQDNVREAHVIRRYHLQRREDYVRYNKLVGWILKLANELCLLPEDDEKRKRVSSDLLQRLYEAGVIGSPKTPISHLKEMLSVAAVCRRRLAVMMVRAKMCEGLKEATTFVEQGHVRIGPDTVTDPGRLVARGHEDLIQWVDRSKIKRQIAAYNNNLDDYDL